MGGLARHGARAVRLAIRPATPSDWRFAAIVLDPPRADLRAAIAGRFAAMLQAGAVAEVAALLDQRLDPALPAMQAHGVPELAAYIAGEIDLAEAERRAVLATGQYASGNRPGSAANAWPTPA